MRADLNGLFGAKAPLERDQHGQPATQQLKLSVTLLLWDVIYADGQRAAEETAHLIRILDHEFRQMDLQSGQLIQLADLLHDHERHLEQAFVEINRGYSLAQREHLGRLLLSMAQIDGRVEASEQEFVHYLWEKLNITV